MLSVQNFSYTYPSGANAIKNVSLSFVPGEFILIAGPNGGGKSTLLKSILGVIPTYYGGTFKGLITFNRKSIREYGVVNLAGSIGIVLQDPESQISNATVWEEVTFALRNLLFPKHEVSLRADHALQAMEISDLKEHSVHDLSGGQMQRVSIAALAALQPKVLIFDEPLANLDPLGVISVIDALERAKEFVDIVIIASHWLDPFLELSTRLVVIDTGEVVLDVDSASIEKHLDSLKTHNIEVPQVNKIKSILYQQGAEVHDTNGILCLPESLTLAPVLVEKPIHTTESVISLNNIRQ